MQEEHPKRKHRIPLSKEELFYVKEIKKLKELKRVEDFKKTVFYKVLNRTNIVLAGFLSYCLLSIVICCNWQIATFADVHCSYSSFNRELQKPNISDIEFTTNQGEFISVKTNDLYNEPQLNDVLYIGRDLIFNKVIKVKLANDNQLFWQIYTYPTFTIIIFALCMGFFIYKVNRHLSINGLLTVFGLFALASLYFILI
jgi:hypothetical protein